MKEPGVLCREKLATGLPLNDHGVFNASGEQVFRALLV